MSASRISIILYVVFSSSHPIYLFSFLFRNRATTDTNSDSRGCRALLASLQFKPYPHISSIIFCYLRLSFFFFFSFLLSFHLFYCCGLTCFEIFHVGFCYWCHEIGHTLPSPPEVCMFSFVHYWVVYFCIFLFIFVLYIIFHFFFTTFQYH